MATLKRTDFLLNPKRPNELSGDFPLQDTVIDGKWYPTPYGESDNQHKEDLIVYDKGWLKGHPTVGFGVNNYINAEFDLTDISKKLTIVFVKDGYVPKIGFVSPAKGGGFLIDTSFVPRK